MVSCTFSQENPSTVNGAPDGEAAEDLLASSALMSHAKRSPGMAWASQWACHSSTSNELWISKNGHPHILERLKGQQKR
jgi:hypothetical protein